MFSTKMTTPTPLLTGIIPKTHKKVSDHIDSNTFNIDQLDSELLRVELELLANNTLGPDSSLTLGTDQNHLLSDLLKVIENPVVFLTSNAEKHAYHHCLSRRATIVLHGDATRVMKFPGQELSIVNQTDKNINFFPFLYLKKDDNVKPLKSVYLRAGDRITF